MIARDTRKRGTTLSRSVLHHRSGLQPRSPPLQGGIDSVGVNDFPKVMKGPCPGLGGIEPPESVRQRGGCPTSPWQSRRLGTSAWLPLQSQQLQPESGLLPPGAGPGPRHPHPAFCSNLQFPLQFSSMSPCLLKMLFVAPSPSSPSDSGVPLSQP